MVIKNFSQLSRTPLRKKALEIIEAGFEAVDTRAVIKKEVKLTLDGNLILRGKKFDLKRINHLYLLGIGKVALDAVGELCQILAEFVTEGFVLDVRSDSLPGIISEAGTHPVVSEKNILASKKIVELLKKAGEQDLIVFVVSGGGSALFEIPYKLTLEDLQKINRALLKSGANIYEVNTVRKHLSLVKGGQAAKLAYPAQVVSLIFSDVPGDDLSFVASGPTVRDKTTVNEAKAFIKKYQLPLVDLKETPKDPCYFQRVQNIVLASGKTALKAMKKKAQKLGFKVEIFSDSLQGEARKIGPKIVSILKKKSHLEAILACGETTVTVRGQGKGGRNQELVLASLPKLKKGQVLVSVASDGWDNTEAAGAIADERSLVRAKKLGLSWQQYLRTNDSFHFFKKLNDIVLTGKTGSNVADFLVVLQ